MTLQIHLSHAGWRSQGSSYARGTAFEGDRQFGPEALSARLEHTSSDESFGATLRRLNGFFSIVRDAGELVLAAVDRVRSIPLFYGTRGEVLFLSDDAEWVRERIGTNERDPAAEIEMLLVGYVTGEETLYSQIRQISAGRLLRAEYSGGNWVCRQEPYYVYTPQNPDVPGDRDELLDSLDAVTEHAFRRLIRWADGRTIMVPLSSGYDSRLVVLMLKRLGYTNVITYTYGRPGNRTSEISRRVAEQLNFRWEFVPYSNEAWAEWYRSVERQAYSRFATNHTSVAHLQDWPAVRELKQRGSIPPDAVFVPGHSGDMIAGGHIPIQFSLAGRVGIEAFLEAMWKKHYGLWNWRRATPGLEPLLRTRALQVIEQCELESVQGASSAFETWNWQERQPKFIVNSVRVYEFFGYEWWMPLWDSEFMDFWTQAPLHWKLGKRLRDLYVTQESAKYAAGLGVDRVENQDEGFWRSLTSLLKRNRRSYGVGLAIHERVARYLTRRSRKRHDYTHHPLAWYGMVPRDRFNQLFTGQEAIRSFLVLDQLGHASFPEAHEKLLTRLSDKLYA